MRKTLLVLTILCRLAAGVAHAESVTLLHDQAVPQAAYAARRLSEALSREGHTVRRERTGYDHLISLAVHPARLGPEEFSIGSEGKVITVLGGDRRGMIYGTLALAEMVHTGTRLANVEATEQKPGRRRAT